MHSMEDDMGALKRNRKSKSSSRSSSRGSAIGSIISAGSSLIGGSRGGGRRSRGKGPQYWANKVLVAKLKKKLYKIKYGGK